MVGARVASLENGLARWVDGRELGPLAQADERLGRCTT